MRSSKVPSKSEDVADVEPPNIQPAMPLRKPHSPAAQTAKREQSTPGPSGTQKFESTRVPPNLTRRPDKKPVNNYRKPDVQNGTDNKSSHYPKPANKEPSVPQTETAYPKAPVCKDPPVPQADTVDSKSHVIKESSVPAVESTSKVTAKVQAASVQPVNNVVPERKLVPKTYLVETLSVGDTVLLSVEACAEDCGTKQSGFVCLSLSDGSEEPYQQLCGPFGELCAAAPRVRSVTPGETFAYFNVTDDAWYRARCLSPTRAALLDGCKLVTLTETDQYTALTAEYAAMPEFCCLLTAKGVALGNNLMASLVSKTATGFTVSLVNAETGAALGGGEVSRWLPDVEWPVVAAAAPVIPEVNRPDVAHNSRVLLVEASALDRVLVRPADKESMRKFDAILEDVLMAGINSKPLKEPPTKGQTVIGVYTDGTHYRALCRRTNVKQNKYLLEYVEFGNSEVTQLEKLYPCPPQLTLESAPTQVSLVKLQTTAKTLTAPATQYLEKIRDDNEELVLTIPSGAQTASTGDEVVLTVAKNKESVNRTVTEMCTPDWKKLEERGGDVLESEVITNDELEYTELPAGGCELDVLDVSTLPCGTVAACQRGLAHARYVLGPLAHRMAEYCDSPLGKEPYLPTLMEVCIAKCPPYPQWFRAVLVDHTPGAPEAKVCYMDYGNVETVPVSDLRKMLPEFVRGVPALALHVEIKDFPKNMTAEQLERAIAHLQMNEEGRGTLRVTRCERRSPGVYQVDAPALIAAMRG